MTDEGAAVVTTETEWPKQVGSGWNTSDGYRFRRKERAEMHQASVDDPNTDQGSHGPVRDGSTDAEEDLGIEEILEASDEPEVRF